MNSLHPETIDAVFRDKPQETAAWLVSFDSFAAIAPIAKKAKIIHDESEIAAKRIIASLGNGDYRSVFAYFTSPEKYPPSMDSLARKLGARSLHGQLDPPFTAAISYKLDKRARRQVPDDTLALQLYDNADTFPLHFEGIAEERFTVDEYASLADFILTIKNETSLWIDCDVPT